MSKNKKTSAVMNVNELAELFGLPSSEEIDESVCTYGCAYDFAYKQALSEEKSEEEAEAAAQAAEQEEREQAYQKWYDAVEFVAKHEFELHKLELVQAYKRIRGRKVDAKRPYDLRVVAPYGWKDAAREIMRTINGVGMFEFSSLKEFMDSGPYTAREAALQHTHWINRHAEVYGDRSPRSMYDGRMR